MVKRRLAGVVWLSLLAVGLWQPSWAVAQEAARRGAVAEVRYPDLGSGADRRHDYYIAMLRLALDKSQHRYGRYRLVPTPMALPQERILRLLSTGEQVDVMWSMTTEERETYLQPVRIPLLKGLMGYRILIVRAADEDEFRSIDRLEQLAEKMAGQGSDWPDTAILRANDLPVTTAPYDTLFTMLQHKRFDYFPRAVNEPWSELKQRPELDLVVDKHLLLYYPTAIYFFVHKDNRALARRLEAGLEAARADGSFDRLFFSHPENAQAFMRSDLLSRRVLFLDNPLLPEQTPLDDATLWWHPGVGQVKD